MVDDFESIKRKVESLRQERDQAKGAYSQILKRIKKEFGCSTLSEAEKKLKELEERERKAAVEYTAEKKKFLKKWKHVL